MDEAVVAFASDPDYLVEFAEAGRRIADRAAPSKPSAMKPRLPDDIISRIRNERASGRMWTTIARDLDRDGYKTARRRRWNAKSVAAVARSGV